jgi:serine protease Do
MRREVIGITTTVRRGLVRMALSIALVAGVASPGVARAQAPAFDESLRRTPVVRAVERARQAVVTIQTVQVARSPFAMFGTASPSEGSGVIIDAAGIVLTNAHVVDKASRIEVELDDGRRFEAEILAADAGIDLAVLRLAGASGLPVIQLGDSDALWLGEPAIALGNPFGLGLTVTQGIVTSTARDVAMAGGVRQTYIQTDAAINPGNSGGALVDIHGRLIGINTAIRSSAEGIGFAIPVNRARKIAGDLLQYGAVQVAWIGADLVDVAPRRFRAPLDGGGALVQRTHLGGPGQKGGLLPGDIIYDLDGHRVGSRYDVNFRLAELRAGDRVPLRVMRAGTPTALTLVSGVAPGDLGVSALRRTLGIAVQPVGGGAVQVTSADPAGSFVAAGLRTGDVILSIEGRAVPNEAELARVVQGLKALHRASARLRVVREGISGVVEVAL